MFESNKQLRCPKCKRYHINVQAAFDIKEEKKGCGYYIYLFCGGFLIEILLAPFRLLFGRKKTYRAGARTYAICQDCGYRWEVK